jgi:hypothetical protein
MVKILKKYWWLIIALLLVALVWLDVFVFFRRGRIVPNRVPRYQVVKDHWLPKLLGSGATTIRNRVLVKRGIVPGAKGLAHEYGHVLETRWFLYLWSKLAGTEYAPQEEAKAHRYAEDHWREFEPDARVVAAWFGHA